MVEPIWVGCHPGNFMSGRKGFLPEAIVIHIMDGSLAGTRAWFNNPAANVSAHYGIGRDGLVHQYVREADTAQHAGTIDRPTWPLLKPRANPNYYTIGIEHAGFERDGGWPDAQLAASAMLAAGIAARWDIPLDAAHIVLHHEIRNGKPCPGAGFDKAGYLDILRGAGASVPMPAKPRFPLSLQLVKAANLRPGASITNQPIALLSVGTRFEAQDMVRGEIVRGNDRWYIDGESRFLWAGATDRA